MRANAPALNQYDGLRITEAAARAGMEPFDFYCRLVLESSRQARVLIHTYSGDRGEEEALRAVLAHPQCLIETDTFEEPARFPLGIERVFINGRAVLEEGCYDAGARAGRVLRG